MKAFVKSLATLLAVAPSFALAAPRPDRTVERAASGTLTTIVTVTPELGEYFGEITINGTPHRVLFDTGSNDLWIKNEGEAGSGASFHQGYGSGSVDGTVAYGTVTVGDITIHNQAYGLVDRSYGSDKNFSGILGLGTSDKQLTGQETSWLKNAIPMLKEPIFVVDIAPGTPGTFTFGYDSQSSTSMNGGDGDDAGSIPVSTANSDWDILTNLPGIDGTIHCDLDTGTTDVLLPNDAYNSYFRGVDKCGSHLPDFKITSNGQTFTMPGKYAGNCGDRIQPQSEETYCILGQPFISAFQLVYNYGDKRVSLVPKA